MFRKLNKKGVIPAFAYVMMGVGTALFTVVPIGLKYAKSPDAFSSFRAKKAVQICVDKGQSNCADMVAGMSKEEVFDYIQDK